MIEGGTASNIIARDCRFSGEIRILPGETVAGWQARLLAEAARLEAAARGDPPRRRRSPSPPAWRWRASSPEADGAAERLARALTGDNGRNVVSYQTEAGQFQERGLSTVICGPGSIDQAHQPDEFISIEQLDAGTAFVRRLIAPPRRLKPEIAPQGRTHRVERVRNRRSRPLSSENMPPRPGTTSSTRSVCFQASYCAPPM